MDSTLPDVTRLFYWGHYHQAGQQKCYVNGNRSSSQQTCHVNVRYYFVTDKIAKGEIHLEHCGSSDMIVDYFTKPLQGSLF